MRPGSSAQRSCPPCEAAVTRCSGSCGARSPSTDEIRWDPAAGELDASLLQGVDALVNLSGENLAKRWTDARKREILDSRVSSTDLLARTAAALDPKPSVLVFASAVGIYGDRGDEILTEESAAGAGFLADVVRAWEAAADPAREAGSASCTCARES